jgi:AraC-like DNA-binding protein
MEIQNEPVVPMPAWLLDRYIAVAAELERMHGAAFAAAFLHDMGVTPCNYAPHAQYARQYTDEHA